MDTVPRSPLDVVTTAIDAVIPTYLSGDEPDFQGYHAKCSQILTENGWEEASYDQALCERIDSMGDLNPELVSEDRP